MASRRAWVRFPFTLAPGAPTFPLRLRFSFHTRIPHTTSPCSLAARFTQQLSNLGSVAGQRFPCSLYPI